MKKNHVMGVFAACLLAFLFDIGDIEAFAGTDATFGSATTGPLGSITKWMTGSMGNWSWLFNGCIGRPRYYK